MPKLGYADAFAKYGATLKNVQWSVCAEAPDGSLVVSLWSHHFKKQEDDAIICKDSASRWSGPGNKEFRERVARAFETKQPVRVVIAHTVHTEEIESGMDASKLEKDFDVRPDWIGEVIEYDGDNYAFRFTRR